MRLFLFVTCLFVVASLVFAAPLEAKGGKGGGGGGGGHGRAGSVSSHGGGPKWNRQSAHPGGGTQRLADHPQKANHGVKPQLADKPQKPDKDNGHEKHARSTSPTDPVGQSSDSYNKKQKQLAIEQQNRDKRIAQAQHLREIGQRNGNQNLLDNADRMEAFAHDHYARRVSHLEKFGVTDPLLNPGAGVTDPLLPGTNGLIDPLSGLGSFDPLPLLP